jgi:hypothetical protein
LAEETLQRFPGFDRSSFGWDGSKTTVNTQRASLVADHPITQLKERAGKIKGALRSIPKGGLPFTPSRTSFDRPFLQLEKTRQMFNRTSNGPFYRESPQSLYERRPTRKDEDVL